MMKKWLFGIAVLAVLAGPSFGAFTMTFSPPEFGNSWITNVNAGGITFDLVGAKIASAQVFESPAVSNFSLPGWALLLDEPQLASWAGPTTNSLQWTMHFEDETDMDVVIDWAFFRGEDLILTTRYEFNEQGLLETYTRDSEYWTPERADLIPVPAPGALLLGTLGTGLVGWLRKRRTM